MSIQCLSVSTCEKYSLTQITGWSTLLYAQLDPSTDVYGMTLQKLCTEDPCLVGARSGTTCVFTENSGCVTR